MLTLGHLQTILGSHAHIHRVLERDRKVLILKCIYSSIRIVDCRSLETEIRLGGFSGEAYQIYSIIVDVSQVDGTDEVLCTAFNVDVHGTAC